MINTNSININPATGLPEKSDFSGNLNFANKKYISPYNTPSTSEFERFGEEDFNEYQRLGVNVRPFSDNQEVRAENQGAGEQLLHGLGKMGVLGITTFADGTLGTIAGLGSLLTGGSFIDNPVSRELQNLNEKSEKWMPSYYTQEGQAPFKGIIPFTEGSANFWGDKIIKNFGFALGAYFSGLATAGLGNLAGERVLASRTAKALANAMLTEGKSQAEINQMVKAFQGGEKIAKDYMKTSKVFADEIKNTAQLADRMSNATQWVSALGGSVGESRMEALGNSRAFKEEELAKLQDKYGNDIPQSELDDLDNRVNNYMNTTFAMNMAILTLTEYKQFSDAFKPKFARQRSILNEVGEGIEGDILGGYKAVKPSKYRYLNLLKNPVYEGTQEQLPFAVQKGSDDFYAKRYDENGKEIVGNFVDSYVKGLAASYGTAEGWEQFATGAIIGALGMPNIPKITGQKGLVQGGIYGEYKEMKEHAAATNKRVQDLNKATEDIRNNDILKDSFEHLSRMAKLTEEQRKALIAGDKFEYQNKEEDKFLSTVLAFYNSGKIEDLESFYKGLSDKKGSDIRDSNKIKDKDGKEIDPFKGLNDTEIETHFKAKSKKANEQIQTIKQLKEDIDSRFANRTEAYKESLLHYAYTVQDAEKRFNELSEEIQRKTGGAFIKTKDEKGNLLENPEPIIENPVQLSKFIDKKNGFEEYTKLVKDYVKRHPEDLDIEEKANDLVKIAQRKKEFLDKYVEGLKDNGKTLEEKIKDVIGDSNKNFVRKEQALSDFKNAALSKGYSLDRTNNSEGIFATINGKLVQFKRLNGKQVAVDPQTGQIIEDFEKTPFKDFISKYSPYLNVLSREEAANHIKQDKINQIKNAQLQAVNELLRNTEQRGKEVNKEIEDKKKQVNKKIEELRELVDDYYKTNFKDEVFRSEVESLISELEGIVDTLRKELTALENERDHLREIYRLYQEEKNTLTDTNEFIDLKSKIRTEQAIENLVNEGVIPGVTLDNIQESIDYIDTLIQQYSNDLNEYESIRAELQKLLDDDKELRDFIVQSNFEDAFNTRFPLGSQKRYSLENKVRFIENLMKSSKIDAPLAKLAAVNRIIETNKGILDLLALMEQKQALKDIGESIRYTEHNVALVEPEIKKLKQLLKEAKDKKEALLDTKERLEYKKKGLLNAYIQFRDRVKQLYTREKVEGVIKAHPKEDEVSELTSGQIKYIEENGAKKTNPKSTTGKIILYDEDHLKKTGEYKDEVDENGNPVYTTSESQLRWGKFLEDKTNEIREGEYQIKYHLHNPNSDSELDNEINDNIPSEKRDTDNDLYAVIVDKEGKPVKVNGKHLFSGIHKTETLFPEEGGVRLLRESALVGNSDYPQAKSLFHVYYEKNKAEKLTLNGETKTGKEWLEDDIFEDLARELIDKVIAKEKEKFNNFRESIKKQLKEGKTTISEITSVSDGIPVINKKVKRSALQLLKKGFKLIRSEVKNESGLWYVELPNGNRVPIETELITEKEARAIIAILQYAMPKGSNVVIETFKIEGDKYTPEISIFPTNSKNQTNPSLLGSLIYYGRQAGDENLKPYNIWGKQVVQYMDGKNLKVVTREQLHDQNSKEFQELLQFLQTKRLNISQAWSKEGKFFYEPKVDSKGNLKVEKHASDDTSKPDALTGYKKFLKNKLKTRLVEATEDKPLFVNKYLEFKEPKELKSKKPKVEETEDNTIPTYDEVPEENTTDFVESMLDAAEQKGKKVVTNTKQVKSKKPEAGELFNTESQEEETESNDNVNYDLDSLINSGEITSGESIETDIEAKKADIERRRQEEFENLFTYEQRLGNYKRKDGINIILVTKNGIGEWTAGTKIPKTDEKGNIFEDAVGQLVEYRYEDKFERFGKGEEAKLKAIRHGLDLVDKKINAKYDAELAALEGKSRKITLTKEDAVKRVKELLHEGIIDKKCN